MGWGLHGLELQWDGVCVRRSAWGTVLPAWGGVYMRCFVAYMGGAWMAMGERAEVTKTTILTPTLTLILIPILTLTPVLTLIPR
jgi:hypothetical protein